MKLAPIVLFTYNRPIHTQKTVEALLDNELAAQSDLIIFADGPKIKEDNNVITLRNYLSTIKGFKSVQIKFNETNQGLAKSIISGVTEILLKYESVIVMEDDLITSPHFLTYMNEALEKYENDDRVVSIHGYNYPVNTENVEVFFLRGADCWGWATWKHGWRIFNPDGSYLLGELKKRKLEEDFDFYGTYPYIEMLKNQVAGKNNSWAIRWYASAFLAGKLTLYPGKSLVVNIGLDGSGTHCTSDRLAHQILDCKKISFSNIPVEENKTMRIKISKHFSKKENLIKRIFKKVIG